MAATRHILSALRAAGFWLVVASVLAGPIGASVASASMKTCGVSCPCDEAQHAEHAEAESHDSSDGCDDIGAVDHDEGAPCDDECPDDCPECSCCRGLMAGLLSTVVPGLPGARTSSKLLAPPEAPANGDTSGVFRPPRSLT